MKFKLPFTTDRGSAEDLSTRREPAPTPDADISSRAPSAAPNDADAQALEIGRRVLAQMGGVPPATTDPRPLPFDPFADRRAAHEAKIQSLRDTMQARAATQAEVIEPLRLALEAAQAAYDAALAQWQTSPTRLAMAHADEALESARAAVIEQERVDREELEVLAVQIRRLDSLASQWLVEIAAGLRFKQWGRPSWSLQDRPPPDFEHTVVSDNRVK